MEPKYHIGFEVHTLDRMIGQSFRESVEQENLSKVQSWIIHYLYDRQDQDIYQRDIEMIFHIARSTATGILQGLEKQGYLIRTSSTEDARMKHLALTPKAVRYQEETIRKIEQTEQMLMQGISGEDLEIFLRVLHGMQRNLKPFEKKDCKKPWIEHPQEEENHPDETKN